MRVGGLLLALIGALTLAGCNQEGSSTSSSLEAKYAPGQVQYSENPAYYVVGEAITPNTLTSSGTAEQVVISPTLPTGLVYDAVTGRITGTPSISLAAKDFDVRVTNGHGSSFTKLRIIVGNPAPVLALSSTAISGVVGTPITALVASNSGGAIVKCATTPSLPTGLSVSTASGSCTISGTPTRVFTTATVTLTASSSARSSTKTFSLSIIDVPPQFSFPTPVQFPRGAAGLTATPASTGGKITGCSSNPALPEGLSLRSDCVITGAPAALSPASTYTLTATNSGGTSTASLSLAVVDQTPEFYYTIPNLKITLVKGTAMSAAVPTITAGVVSSCSAVPALPAGLTLSTTCTISGTPSAVQAETTHVISATNGAGSGTTSLKITVNDRSPLFSYATGLLVIANRATANFASIHTSGTPENCVALPTLPAGLSLASDCKITGSPTAASPTREYSVTASNSGGSFTRKVQLLVTEVAPLISYSPSSVRATLGTALSAVLVTNAGGAITSCSITPALPGSLTLSSTCTISGTPVVESPSTSYTVTATNSVGTSNTTITLEVVDRLPQFAYPGPQRILTLNEPISTWIPVSTGGPVTSCSVTPNLPAGLTLSSLDCSISGTPSELSPQANYTVTGSNTGGSSTTSITLTINDRPPSIQFIPATTRFILSQSGTSFTSLNSGGAATSCTISPSAPDGLALGVQSGACVVSGTPTALSSKSGYTVTATNSGGTSQALLEIEVVDSAPQISFNPDTRTLTRTVAMTAWTPSNSGGTVTSCLSSPALPQGLSLSQTCEISGTPITLSESLPYTITATNTGGTSTVIVRMGVADVAPVLSFSPTVYTLKKGVLSASITPTNSGGAVVSCSVDPALPSGLSIGSNCVISGTPTVTLNSTPFTVTGTNTGGSDSKEITLTVNDSSPVISYPVQSILATVGTALTDVVATNTGGAISSCLASPSLPSGLTLSSACTIGGTPSLVSDAAVYTITASSTGGSGAATMSITVVDRAPSLSFSPTTGSFIKSTAITAWSSSNSGGDVTVCSVSPALPAGLSLNLVSGNCEISGTPTAVSPVASYTVTGSNTGGSSSKALSISVADEAPTLSYSPAQVLLTKNTTMTAVTATLGGGAPSACASSPLLPAGLSLSSNCTISGKPTVTAAEAEYTITASNAGGSGSFIYKITVQDAAPVIAYSPASFTYSKDVTITTVTALQTGGLPTSCSSSPDLPSGLSLSSSCDLSGKPTVVAAQGVYTITGSNSAGSSNASLTITVNDHAPVISYATVGYTYTYTKDVTIQSVDPARSGGAITSCVSAPQLPTGLSLDSDCTLSGTPTLLKAASNYTITASNTGGSSSEVISIAVNDAPPTISYANSPFTFLRGQIITTQTALITGGSPTECASAPTLPAGLILSSDCTITGTPTGTSTASSYSITAKNSGGQGSTLITIHVDEPLPVISYPGSPYVFTKSQSVGTITVSNSGGSITTCSASPSLPNPLTLSNSCTITGTPTALQSAQTYTLTATNSYGSATASISITVVDQAPSIAYYGGPYLYTRDQAIASLSVTNTGGGIASCSVTPALPAGLSISTACLISGTPSAISALAAYTVTASNTGGSSSTVISVEVISALQNVPNVFLNWLSLSALNGSWNGTANTEGRIWNARIDGSSVVLNPSLSLGWASMDLVQPPRLAPNGSYWLAVSTRNLSGNPSDPALPCSNIWKVSPDGSQWTALTTSTSSGQDSIDPAVSPDSTMIAFASKRPTPAVTNVFNIWTMNSSGGAAAPLTQETGGTRHSIEPAYSPSGSTIIFSSKQKIGNLTSNSYNLWKITVSTGALSAFSTDTTAGRDRRQPRYSNDGTKIVYVSNRPLTVGGASTASMNLWTSTASSLSETAITTTTASGQDVSAPEFSVSDQYIAFSGYLPISGVTPQSKNIWVYDSANATTTAITKNTNANLDSHLMPGSTW